jgi:hypothetical protein
MLAHTKGVKETSWLGPRYEAIRCCVPSMGMCQLLATLCVTSSLTLVTLGGSDPSSGFRLLTLSFSRPPAINICFYIPCSHSRCDVRGVGEAGKLSLPSPLLRLRGPSRLTTDTVGFKAGSCPCAPLYPFTPSTILSLPPSLHLKKERGTERGESKKEGK